MDYVPQDLRIPVRMLPHERDEEPRDGVALCLSGGGYRAMLFHLGVLWRLNEAAWLPRFTRVSSVSGGSITAAVLGASWQDLAFQDGVAAKFGALVVEPIQRLADHTVDIPAVLRGGASPFSRIGDQVAAAYDKHLFQGKALADLPDAPTFVINATNIESAALFRFTKAYVADWRVGRVRDASIGLAVAVACSSAFPPFLSPYRLDLRRAQWTTDPGNELTDEGYRGYLDLSDGGVYDNLGLETAYKRCKCLIVSDGGGHISDDPDPAGDWARHTSRVLQVIDNQVRSLRKRQLIGAFKSQLRDGAYIGIRSDITNYGSDVLPAPYDKTMDLAGEPTRLKSLPSALQQRLINWGYAICDAGLRKHVDPTQPAPSGPPYPPVGLG